MEAKLGVTIDPSGAKSGEQAVVQSTERIKQALKSVETRSKSAGASLGSIKNNLSQLAGDAGSAGTALQRLVKNADLSSMSKAMAHMGGLEELKADLKQAQANFRDLRREAMAFIKDNAGVGIYKTKTKQAELNDLKKALTDTEKMFGKAGDSIDKEMARASKAVQKHEQDVTKSSSGIMTSLKRIIATYLSFRAIKGVFTSIIGATVEQENVNRQLDATLKATGHAAGVTAGEIRKLSSDMQGVTNYGDEAVTSMANLLLTFKNVKGDTFQRATVDILDMATALNMNLDSAAQMVGKALHDPVLGMTTLRRAGVTLSESQQKLVKDFVKTGEIAKAQDVILGELENRYKGSAAAARDTLGGAIESLKNAWGDLLEMDTEGSFGNLKNAIENLIATLKSDEIQRFKEQIGDLVASALNKLVEVLKWSAENVDGLTAAAKALIAISVVSWVNSSVTAFAGMVKAAEGATVATKLLSVALSPAGILGVAVAGAVLLDAKRQMDEAKDAAERLEKATNDVAVEFQNATTEQLVNELANLEVALGGVKEQARLALDEVLKLSTQKFIKGGNGIMSGVGPATMVIAKNTQTEELQNQIKDMEARETALRNEIASRKTRERVSASPYEKMSSPKEKKGKKEKSEIEKQIDNMRDQMKYLDADGTQFLSILDQWKSKLKPLSDDWKRISDFQKEINDSAKQSSEKAWSTVLQKLDDQINYTQDDLEGLLDHLKTMRENEPKFDDKGLITQRWKDIDAYVERVTSKLKENVMKEWAETSWQFAQGFISAGDYVSILETRLTGLVENTEEWKSTFSEVQSLKGNEVSKMLDSLSRQYDMGKISAGEYQSALVGLMDEYEKYPLAVQKCIDALQQFNQQQELTIMSTGAQLQQALKDSQKAFVELEGKGILGVVDGLASAIAYGDDFGASLKKLGQDIVYTTLKMILMQQVSKMLGGFFGGGGNLFGGSSFFAQGGVISSGVQLTKYASGGVVDRPTLFPMKNGMGLMGEVPGKAEGVFPLMRMPNGDLGVQASGQGQSSDSAPSVAIHVENKTGTPVQEDNISVDYDSKSKQFIIGVVLENLNQNGSLKKAVGSVRK